MYTSIQLLEKEKKCIYFWKVEQDQDNFKSRVNVGKQAKTGKD